MYGTPVTVSEVPATFTALYRGPGWYDDNGQFYPAESMGPSRKIHITGSNEQVVYIVDGLIPYTQPVYTVDSHRATAATVVTGRVRKAELKASDITSAMVNEALGYDLNEWLSSQHDQINDYYESKPDNEYWASKRESEWAQAQRKYYEELARAQAQWLEGQSNYADTITNTLEMASKVVRDASINNPEYLPDSTPWWERILNPKYWYGTIAVSLGPGITSTDLSKLPGLGGSWNQATPGDALPNSSSPPPGVGGTTRRAVRYYYKIVYGRKTHRFVLYSDGYEEDLDAVNSH